MTSELKEYLSNIKEVSHITFDPNGPGVVRLHLVPPKKVNLDSLWVLIINGKDILPITCGWAILLREFINQVNESEFKPITKEALVFLVKQTIDNMHRIFPKTKEETFKKDLNEMIDIIMDLAHGKTPSADIGYMSLKEYAKFMKAPHRMDLMISSMSKDGCWHCNQKCLHCYAGEQKLAVEKELSTDDWKKVIDSLYDACIPQLTFTGGEPTLREDLVELITYSSWFVTRLNTNGRLLTKSLCSELYEASLDAVQVTLYSHKEEVHNLLVGAPGFNDTINGIKNAIEAGLNLSINTPLCSLNKDYIDLIKYAHNELGVNYFTCSSLILTGHALEDGSKEVQLSNSELTSILKEVKEYCDEHECEINFTSPGWLSDEELIKLGYTVPTCGACLSNMAISPSGNVIPCQSWLSDDGLGNILEESFNTIWNDKKTKKLRKEVVKCHSHCLLNDKSKGEK